MTGVEIRGPRFCIPALPAIGCGLPLGGGVALSREALFSQEQLLGGVLLCTTSGQLSWHLGVLVLKSKLGITAATVNTPSMLRSAVFKD